MHNKRRKPCEVGIRQNKERDSQPFEGWGRLVPRQRGTAHLAFNHGLRRRKLDGRPHSSPVRLTLSYTAFLSASPSGVLQHCPPGNAQR